MAVVGFALIALTPAAPAFVRRIDAFFVHLYRVFDSVVVFARDVVHDDLSIPRGLTPAVFDAVRAGVGRWDSRLRSGLADAAPERATVVARVVALDRARRVLLVDAGPDVDLAPGDPVAAGAALLGRVLRAESGVAVVETPWSKEARFAGASVGSGDLGPIRFVMRGLDRPEAVAAVTNPERREGLKDGLEVITPELDDLLPESVDRAPPGLLMGTLALDEWLAHASGEVAFLVRPIVDVELLDAVVIGVAKERVRRTGASAFVRVPLTRLSCELLSTWREGAVASGSGAAIGGAVIAEGHLVGTVEDARLGTVRIRGLFDSGNPIHVLVLAANDTFPAQLVAMGRSGAIGRARIARLTSDRSIAAGDRLVSAGRGAHVGRGHVIGVVEAVEDDMVFIRAPVSAPGRTVHAIVRAGFPQDPWGR